MGDSPFLLFFFFGKRSKNEIFTIYQFTEWKILFHFCIDIFL